MTPSPHPASSPAPVDPPYRRLLRLGMWPSVGLIMAGSTLLSVLATGTMMWLLMPQWLGSWPTIMVLAVSVPMVCGGIIGIVVMRMLIQLDEARREVQRLAITDGLTGLFNRRHFMELAEREFQRSTRYGLPLAVVMLDADHFKRINDVHGHAAGDEVLRGIAKACAQSVRAVDALARYGGEEFVVLMPMTECGAARHVAERIRENVAALQMKSADGVELRVTVSVGVAALGRRTTPLGDLLSRADQALYIAKDNGRDRVETAAEEPGMPHRAAVL